MSPFVPRPVFRTARAVVFAAVCVVLAVTAHVLANGTVPFWAAATGFFCVLGVTLVLAGHERSLATIVGGLLGGQFALHVLFSAASDAAHHPAAHAAALHEQTAGSDVVLRVAHGADGPVMTLAHTVAALFAAWWLRRGERAAWSLARRIAAAADRPIRLLIALLTVEPAAAPPRTAPETADAVVPTGRVLRHQVVRRGPPARSRALACLS
ncbi:MAG TPA: MFS transporter [Spirillospora sp.]